MASSPRSSLPLTVGAGGMDCPNPNECAVAGLPDDLFVDILSRVALDLPRFKCVAKAWRRLIDELLRRKEHPRTLRGFFYMDEGMWNWGNGGGFNGGIRGFLELLPSVPLSIDSTFNFLTELPWIHSVDFVATCNGLLLFEDTDDSLDDCELQQYIVCNPATQQWEAMCPPRPLPSSTSRSSHLVFDPSVSSNFHIIQLLLDVDQDDEDEEEEEEEEEEIFSVHTYSSETGKWSHQEQLIGQGSFVIQQQLGAFVNSMLHIIINDYKFGGKDRVFAVDVQGKIHKIIQLPWPAKEERNTYITDTIIANSKGSLYFICKSPKGYDPQLSIWVLEDYEAQRWVLKDTVSYLELFGNHSVKSSDFHVVTVHQDCSIIFFRYNKHLISYDMDHKAVRVAGIFEDICPNMPIVPYVPHFKSMTNE